MFIHRFLIVSFLHNRVMLDSRVVFVRHILSFFELLFLLGALFCLDIGRRKKSRGAGFSRRLKKKNLPSQSKDEKSFVDKHVYLPIPSFFSLFTNTHRMFETFSFLPPLSDADIVQASAILVEQRLDSVHRVRGPGARLH